MAVMQQRRRVWRRVLIGLALLSIAGLGFRLWQYSRRTAAYYLHQAQRAVERGDRAAAELHLRNLIRVAPDDVAGRLKLVEFYLERHADGTFETFATRPQALEQLREAVARRADDKALQERLMTAYLEIGQQAAAVEVARTAVKLGSEHVMALGLVAWDDLEKKDLAAAEPTLQRLIAVETPPRLRTLLMQMRMLREADRQPELHELVGRWLQDSAEADPQHVAYQSDRDPVMMENVLLSAVDLGRTTAESQRRASQALTILENLTPLEKTMPARARWLTPGAKILGLLERKYPLRPEDGPELHTQRAWLWTRFEKLALPIVSAGPAAPEVHFGLARTAMDRDDDLAAIELLQRRLDGPDVSDENRKELLQLQMVAVRRLIQQRRLAAGRKYLNVLAQRPETAVWADLIGGAAALEEGRMDEAEQAFSRVRQKFGTAIALDMALVQARLQRQEWQAALLLLESVEAQWATLSPEELAWVDRYLGGREGVGLATALAWLGSGDFERAQPHLRALERTPAAARAARLLIWYHWNHDAHDASREVLRQARAAAPDDVSLVWLEADLALAEKGPQAAVEELMKFVADSAAPPAAALAATRWWLARGRFDQALQWLADIDARFGPSPDSHLLRVEALLRSGRLAPARDALRAQPPEARLESRAAWLGARIALLSLGCQVAAGELAAHPPHGSEADELLLSGTGLEAMLPVLTAEPGFGPAIQKRRLEVLQAISKLDPGKLVSGKLVSGKRPAAGTDYAVEQLAGLIEQTADDQILLLAGVDLALRNGSLTHASQWIPRLEVTAAAAPLIGMYKAAIAYQLGRYAEAREEVERALAGSPESVSARVLAVQIRYAQGEKVEALADIESLLEARPELWQVALLRAEVLEKLNRHSEASAVLEALLPQQPDRALVYARLAASLQAQTLDEQALAVLRKGLQRLPQERLLRGAEIRLLCVEKKWKEADAAARKWIALVPHRDTAVALARLFLDMKWFAAARQWADYAARSTKGNDYAALRLLLAEISRRESEAAPTPEHWQATRDLYLAVLSEQPSNMAVANNLAWLWVHELNQPEQALPLAERIRAEIPDDRLPAPYVDTLAIVYRAVGRREEAERLVDLALQRSPQAPELSLQAALNHAAAGRLEEAASALEEARRLGLAPERLDAGRAEIGATGAAVQPTGPELSGPQ